MNHDLKYDLSSFRKDLEELSVFLTSEQEEKFLPFMSFLWNGTAI